MKPVKHLHGKRRLLAVHLHSFVASLADALVFLCLLPLILIRARAPDPVRQGHGSKGYLAAPAGGRRGNPVP